MEEYPRDLRKDQGNAGITGVGRGELGVVASERGLEVFSYLTIHTSV